MQKEIINVSCPACSHSFRAYKPQDERHNLVCCPKCRHKITLQLNPVPIRLPETPVAPEVPQAPAPPPSAAPATPPVLLGEAVKKSVGGQEVYVYNKAANVGEQCRFVCPECGKTLIDTPAAAGMQKRRCPGCQTFLLYKTSTPQAEVVAQAKPAVAPQTPPKEKPAHQETLHFNLSNVGADAGKLVWGSLLHRKHRDLEEGRIVIGRADKSEHSDIELDDSCVSRRSLAIDVSTGVGGKGYEFKFTVLKSLNPVVIAGKMYHTGDSAYLNFGDTIKLGNTTLIFKKKK